MESDGTIGRRQIEIARAKLIDDSAVSRVETLAAKQRKILCMSIGVSMYEHQVDAATDVGGCTDGQFERYMRTRNRIDRAFVKIARAAVHYNVSALKSLTVNIGSQFLTFPVWGERDGIPFRLEDENILRYTKTQSLDYLIKALKRMDRVVYTMEYIVSGSYEEGNAVRTLQPSSAIVMANYADRAQWVDFEVLPPKYVNERELNNGTGFSPSSFHRRIEPGDNLKVTTIRVNAYPNFDQRLHGFAPIPSETFAIFLVTPIPPADVV